MLQAAAHIGVGEALFWRLTPAAFAREVEAWAARARREDERAAWVVAAIHNMAGRALKDGETVTVDDLLGPRGGAATAAADAAREEAERVARRMALLTRRAERLAAEAERGNAAAPAKLAAVRERIDTLRAEADHAR